MIIDAHCHIDPIENPPEKMIPVMDADGIDKAVLLAPLCDNFALMPKALMAVGRGLLLSRFAKIVLAQYEASVTARPGKVKVQGQFYDVYDSPDNSPVIEALKRYPDRFLGFVSINPKNNPSAGSQFEKAIREPGMCGLKVHPWFHVYNPSELLPELAGKCQDLGIPMLIHLGGSPETGNVQGLIDRFPRLNIILAHLGLPWFKRSEEQAKRHPNVYLDISGPYLSAGIVARAAKEIGTHKLIYGTDGPFGIRTRKAGRLSYAHSKKWVERLPVSQREKEMIFSGNLLGLLKPCHAV